MSKKSDRRENGLRLGFQFKLFQFNLFGCGAVLSFAISPEKGFSRALLVVPIISFILFSMWVHHATVNRLRMSWPDKTEGNSVFGSVLRVSSITLSVLFNFLGIPAFALVIAPSDTNAWIIILDSLLIAMIFIGYLSWLYLQYFSPINGPESDADAPEPRLPKRKKPVVAENVDTGRV